MGVDIDRRTGDCIRERSEQSKTREFFMNMKNGKVAACAAVVVMAASLHAGTALAADLVISNWDGYMAKDIAESFKQATGLEIEVVNHGTNEEIMGKIMAGQ